MRRAGRSEVFHGHIAGVGSTSGVRVVVGWWHDSPLGSFADAMVETADGRRVLLAASQAVAQFVGATYTFDEVRIEPITVTGEPEARWEVRSPSLALALTVGSPMPLGRLLALVPRRVATSPVWCRAVDPVARLALRGVRTAGTAREGRQEFYGATGLRRVTTASGSFEGADLGTLAPVDPPCRFGFSSTPRAPGVTTVTTTVVSRSR